MSALAADLDTDQQPPMTVPLRHFVVGMGFLFAGTLVGAAQAANVAVGQSLLAHVHLLLVGWVCITIMGAMTQFVPVWTGVQLHSKRLARWELWLVTVGLLGFAFGLLTVAFALLPVFGAVMLVGFWVFVYNIGRSLARVTAYDVTSYHFLLALGFFLLVTALGLLLAVTLTSPLLPVGSFTTSHVLAAHATLAVFGAVGTTVLGAVYQLGTMFTQTELHGFDLHVKRTEMVLYPVGVLLLAGGRLLSNLLTARVGAAFVLVSVFAFGLVLLRKLRESQVPWTPMLSRYTVAGLAMLLWAAVTAPAWLRDPLAPDALFGAPGLHLFVVGVVGFVVLGTLYHVVPFIVWVHRYSDLLGYERVPMIDDLYDDRIATVDLAAFLLGAAIVVAGPLLSAPASVLVLGGVLLLVGVVLFSANMLLVIRRHSTYSVPGVLFDSLSNPSDPTEGVEELHAENR